MTKEKKRQNTEQQILEAAEREFLMVGYDGARTTTIAKAAGVTHTMLHYYFRTKEKLFERIMEQKLDLMSQSLAMSIGDSSLPIIERIKSGIATHFDFVAANPMLPRFVINEVISHPQRSGILESRVSVIVGGIFKELQTSIDEAADRGEIERVDAFMLMLSIVSLNIFAFVSYPFMEQIGGDLLKDKERFLSARKAENIEIILRRIHKRNLL